MTPVVDSTAPWSTHNATGGGCRTTDGEAKPDRNAVETHLVETLGYVLVGTLHGSHRHQCVNVCMNYCEKLTFSLGIGVADLHLC